MWLFVLLLPAARGDDPQQATPDQTGPAALKNLSLEELSQIEVTSPSKEPTPAFRSPVAIYVITADDIRRSGVTTIPDALRLAPGVEVAQIDGSKWAIGIRGFGTRLSRSVLVLIDGRTVYTPLFAGTYWEVSGHAAGRHRPHRSDPRPWRHDLGAECGGRRHQHHYEEHAGHEGSICIHGRRNVKQGFFNFRYGGAATAVTGPRIAYMPRDSHAARKTIRWKQFRRLAGHPERIPNRLAGRQPRCFYASGRRLSAGRWRAGDGHHLYAASDAECGWE